MRRAELLAAMFVAEMDKCDGDPIHYDTEEELNSRRLGMGPPGTTGVCIGRQDTGVGRPGDPQQPTSGAHAVEPAGNANPPPSTAMDEDTQSSAAADPGPDAQTPPAAPSGRASDAEEAPCPQATPQPGAEACAVQATGGTGRTDAGGQGRTCTTKGPSPVLHEERAE